MRRSRDRVECSSAADTTSNSMTESAGTNRISWMSREPRSSTYAAAPGLVLRAFGGGAGLPRLRRSAVHIVDIRVKRRRSAGGGGVIAFANEHHDRRAVPHFGVSDLPLRVLQHHAAREAERAFEE